MSRREYELLVSVNSRQLVKVIVDSHYEVKHSGSVSDEVILNLVRLLDGGVFPPQERSGVYEYFVADNLKFEKKVYKLVWLLEDGQSCIGVVNAYRRKDGVSQQKGRKEG